MSEGKDKDQHGTHLQAVSARGQELTVYDPSVQQVEEDETIDLREYWRILVKRKWTVLGVAVIVVTAALLSSLLMVPEYRSTARIELNPESARILNYQDFAPEQQGWNATSIFFSTQFEIMRSSALAQRVIRDEQVQNHPELLGEIRQRSLLGEIKSLFGTLARAILPGAGGAESATSGQNSVGQEVQDSRVRRAAGSLRSRVSVEQVEGSRLVDVRVRSFDPQLAAQLANSLVENYVEMSMERRYEAGNEARAFLEDQLEDMRIQLERADAALMDFARENEVADLDERLNRARAAIQQFSDRRTEVEAELVELESWKNLIEAGQTEHLDPVVNNDTINGLEERLVDARSEYASLSERFQDSYPAVQEVLSRMERLEQEIADEKERIIGSVLGRYENLQAQSDALEQAIQDREARMLALNEQAVQYNILRREFETNRELYDGLLQRMKEIGVAAGIQEN